MVHDVNPLLQSLNRGHIGVKILTTASYYGYWFMPALIRIYLGITPSEFYEMDRMHASGCMLDNVFLVLVVKLVETRKTKLPISCYFDYVLTLL